MRPVDQRRVTYGLNDRRIFYGGRDGFRAFPNTIGSGLPDANLDELALREGLPNRVQQCRGYALFANMGEWLQLMAQPSKMRALFGGEDV